jgi:hypothetical protein
MTVLGRCDDSDDDDEDNDDDDDDDNDGDNMFRLNAMVSLAMITMLSIMRVI